VASGAYDGTSGNPSGSLADKSEIAVGLLGLFSPEAVETSPTFTVTESGASSVDKSNGTKQKAVAETLEGASGFVAKSGPGRAGRGS
jgi:hypothetical protein